MEKLMLLTVLFLIMLGSCNCQCSNSSTNFRTNLRTLLNSLTKNAPLHDGFYNTSVGNKPNEVFGTLNCKPNISKNDCANCFRYPIEIVDHCPKNEKETLSTSCSMKYSDNNFFGVWSNFSISVYGANGLDDPLVFSNGFSMMQDLASSVPHQPLMYQSAEIKVGGGGKRYGIAQCARDLSKLNCQNCLEDRLVTYRSHTENRTGWAIIGVSCSMWYTNVSNAHTSGLEYLTPLQSSSPPGGPTPTSGVQRFNSGLGIFTVISIGISTVTVIIVTKGVQRFNSGLGIFTVISIGISTVTVIMTKGFHFS